MSVESKELKESFDEYETEDLTETKISSEDGFTIEMAQDAVLKGYERCRSAQGKNLVMLIGNTRSGKSTTINYFLGHELIKVRDKKTGKLVIEVKKMEESKADRKATEETHAIIGHSSNSETLYPAIYIKDDLAFCDCPGFGDDRGEEASIEDATRLSIALNIELAAKTAENIQAIVVVIAYRELQGSATDLKDLARQLFHLFKFPQGQEKSLFFAITQAPDDVDRDQIVTEINALRLTLTGNIRKHPIVQDQKPSEKRRELEDIVGFLKMMTANQSNILMLNPLDKTQRNGIITTLGKVSHIPLDAFDFENYNELRSKFKDQIDKFVRTGTQFLSDVVELPVTIQTCQNEIENINNSIQFNKNLIAQNKRGTEVKQTLEVKEAQVQMIREKIQNNKKKEGQLVARVNLLTIENAKLRKEAKDLQESEILEVLWSDSVREERNSYWWWGWAGRTTKEFEYPLRKPFDNVLPTCSNGGFKDGSTAEDKAAGIYKTTYQSVTGETGEALVQVRIQKKNTDATRARCIDIAAIVAKNDGEHLNLEKQKKKYVEENEQYERIIKNIMEDSKNKHESWQSEVQQLESGVRVFSDNIKQLENKIKEMQEKLIKAQQYVKDNIKRFEMIKDMSSKKKLNFQSALVRAFVGAYEKHEKFEHEGMEPTKTTFHGQEVPDQYTNMFSGEIMVDPVSLNACGHTFERAGISQYIEDKGKCPTCRGFVQVGAFSSNRDFREVIENWKEKAILESSRSKTYQGTSWMTPPKGSLSLEEIEENIQALEKTRQATLLSLEQINLDIDDLTKQKQKMKDLAGAGKTIDETAGHFLPQFGNRRQSVDLNQLSLTALPAAHPRSSAGSAGSAAS